jgi:hypothetical protein
MFNGSPISKSFAHVGWSLSFLSQRLHFTVKLGNELSVVGNNLLMFFTSDVPVAEEFGHLKRTSLLCRSENSLLRVDVPMACWDG